MLIKQKLKLYEKHHLEDIKYPSRKNTATAKSTEETAETQQRMGRLEWMMEKYLWKYVDKLDGKLEEVSEKVMQQVDKYVLGEAPEKF